MTLGKQAARGYGYKHRTLRAALKPIVEAGKATCSRCGQPIKPTDQWDLDHTDDHRTYRGPAHRACNRSTAGHDPKGIGDHVSNPEAKSATQW